MIHFKNTDLKTKKIISKKTAESLKVINPKTAKCYITLKIHKENNPRRHHSINCYPSEISRSIDHHLEPLVKEIPSHLKYTNDFIKKKTTLKFRKIHFNDAHMEELVLY